MIEKGKDKPPIIVKGTLTDVCCMSDGTEYWVKLDNNDDEELIKIGQRVEVHVKD